MRVSLSSFARWFSRLSPGAQARYFGIGGPGDLIPRRPILGPTQPYISNDTALNNSAVWAALRLRADLMSTLPVDGFRKVDFGEGPIQIDANLTPFMLSPDFMEWRYSSQIELDRSGNSIGIIRSKAGGYPAEIELCPSSAVSVRTSNGKILKYRIYGELYNPEDVWHEKQFTVSGFPLGLSPVMHAAFTLGQYVSIQQFATDWFVGGATPRARLKNTAKKLSSKEALVVKEAWRASQSANEPFVHGSDWDYDLIQAQQASADWMNAQKLTYTDVARFFGVPSDLIDAAVSGQSVTYANISQRNLQFLIMHLGPAIARRENSWNQLLPRPRFVKVNTDALLRLDPLTRAQMIQAQIDSRVLAPSEARQLDNREPFTGAQIKEFDMLGLNRRGATALSSLAPLDLEGKPVAVTVAEITAGLTAVEPTPDNPATEEGNPNG